MPGVLKPFSEFRNDVIGGRIHEGDLIRLRLKDGSSQAGHFVGWCERRYAYLTEHYHPDTEILTEGGLNHLSLYTHRFVDSRHKPEVESYEVVRKREICFPKFDWRKVAEKDRILIQQATEMVFP